MILPRGDEGNADKWGSEGRLSLVSPLYFFIHIPDENILLTASIFVANGASLLGTAARVLCARGDLEIMTGRQSRTAG